MDRRIVETINNLKKNNFNCLYCETKEEVIPLLDHIIKDNTSVSFGGSTTLLDIGVIDYLRNRDIELLDRYNQKYTDDEMKELFRKSFLADYYITSSNAITVTGELYNVDGRGNRVAAMIYGPEQVIVIAGINKIVNDIDEAIKRVETVAAPKNVRRLNIDTPCSNKDDCNGCSSSNSICRNYVLIKRPLSNRITVILINESLGY